jgi:hypothetical protein
VSGSRRAFEPAESPLRPGWRAALDGRAALDLRADRDLVAGRLLLVAGACAYAALLVATYVTTIAPAFTYLGYTHAPAAPPYLALGFALSVLPAAWLPLRLVRPSASVLWIVYLLAYVPSALIPLLSLVRPAPDVILLIAALGAAFALLALVPRLPLLRVRRPRVARAVFWAVLVAGCAFLLAQVTSEHGVSLDLPNLADVYDVREEYKEAEAGRWARLGVSWIGNVVAPFLVALALVRRRLWLVLPGLSLQAYLFSITGFRSLLFSALILVALLVASLARGRFFGVLVPWGGALLIVAAGLLDRSFGTIAFTSTFVRRLIATPGILTGWYFDFFSDNPQVRLAHSVLARWFEYPYDVAPPLLIGARYFGRDTTYANANFWADGFANFGFAGIFGYTVILALILWLADSVVGTEDAGRVRLAVLLLGVPAFTLSNTALTTTLLTHGFGLALLVLLTLPRTLTAGGGAPRRRGRWWRRPGGTTVPTSPPEPEAPPP